MILMLTSFSGKGLGSLGSGVMGGLAGNKKQPVADDEGESDSDRQANSGFF